MTPTPAARDEGQDNRLDLSRIAQGLSTDRGYTQTILDSRDEISILLHRIAALEAELRAERERAERYKAGLEAVDRLACPPHGFCDCGCGSDCRRAAKEALAHPREAGGNDD